MTTDRQAQIAERDRRRAEALRSNLRRRKGQARARDAEADTPADDAAG